MKRNRKGKYSKRNSDFDILLVCMYGVMLYMILTNKMDIFKYGNKMTNVICAIILPLTAIFVIGYGVVSKFKKFQMKEKYLNATLEMVDTMSGEEFEEFLKVHFEKQGYIVQLTPGTNDYGIDLICKKRYSSTNEQENGFVVQAKRYKGKVGVAAVQQVIAGAKYYDCKYGMVITNSYFTKNAWELAKKSGITLWDRNVLHDKFKIS